MSTRPHRPADAGAFPRRTLLVAAGISPLLVTVVGCSADDPPGADAVTPDQVDRLAGQVRAQEQLVAAYATAFAAAPDLAAAAAVLADQAGEQLRRLRAAAPSVTGAATSSSAAAGSGTVAPAPVSPADARAGLRSQVAATADSHALACLEFTGARAALLGSIAAGLRGQDGQLA